MAAPTSGWDERDRFESFVKPREHKGKILLCHSLETLNQLIEEAKWEES